MTVTAELVQQSSEPAPHDERPDVTARVLHLINGEHYSGAERVQDLLALRLPERGFDVGFACVKPGRFPTDRQSLSTPLLSAPMRGRFDFRLARRLARHVRDEGYTLLHAHTPRTALLARLVHASTSVPFVYHVHSPTSRDSTHRLRSQLSAWTERRSLRRAAHLIAVSPSLRRLMFEAGFPEDRVTYVPNGVPAVEADFARRPPTDVWTLGVVALFRPRKGMEVLLDALSLLRRRGAAVRLHAVGEFETPQYELAIKRHAERLGLTGAIHWTGFTQNVHHELAQMDLMVLPSLFGEGLPMVVLEAMAAALPVVATDVEGVPEAIRHETDGVLVEPGSPSSLADGVSRIVDGSLDWQTLRISAHRRHAQLFSDQAMADGVAEVYRRVLCAK